MRSRILACFVGSLLLSLGCSDDPASVFSSKIDQVVIEVDYQVGAEPFDGPIAGVDSAWRLFESNVSALLAEHEPDLVLPTRLSEMEPLSDIVRTSFDREAILEIAEQHRSTADTDVRRTYYIVFLDGLFESSAGLEPNVLGVSLGGTSIVAMFKPVINGPFLPSVQVFVEQSTLVHEFGHAVGLVNNGVPLTSDHHDSENGAHCTNKGCVMFYLNEGAEDLVQFVNEFVTTGNSVLFGDECVADTRAVP